MATTQLGALKRMGGDHFLSVWLVCVCLSCLVSLSVCLYVSQSVSLSVGLSVCVPVCFGLFVCLFVLFGLVGLSVCLVWLGLVWLVCLFVCLIVWVCFLWLICLAVCFGLFCLAGLSVLFCFGLFSNLCCLVCLFGVSDLRGLSGPVSVCLLDLGVLTVLRPPPRSILHRDTG